MKLLRMMCLVCVVGLLGTASPAGAKPKVKVRSCGTLKLVVDDEVIGPAPIQSFDLKCTEARSVMSAFLSTQAARGNVKGFFCQNNYLKLAPGSEKKRPIAVDCGKGQTQTIYAKYPDGTY